MTHLSDLAIDRWLVGELGLPARRIAERHVAGCGYCRTRRDDLVDETRQLASVIATEVVRAARAQVIDAPRRARRFSAGGVIALMVAISLVAIVREWRADDADDPSIPLKGNLALEVLVHRADGSQAIVAPGEALHAGDELAFRVSFDVPGELAIVALDEDGTVTMYLAPSIVQAGRGRVLDGAIDPDPARGNERVVALWCPESVAHLIDNASILIAAQATRSDPSQLVTLALPCEQASTWFAQR